MTQQAGELSEPREWFATPDVDNPSRDGTGLRFSCTLCGNCCSGPEGYVLVSDEEAAALARRLGVSVDEFLVTYTHATSAGRSLTERQSASGLDCVFLDRQKVPGRAVCGVYEDRPLQCRTWPFWPSVVKSRQSWERAKRVCPGIDHGQKHDLVQVRVMRDAFNI